MRWANAGDHENKLLAAMPRYGSGNNATMNRSTGGPQGLAVLI